MQDYEPAAPETISGSSTESIQDAVRNALQNNPRSGNFRSLVVSEITVEEGGVVGGTTFRVALNPQPLPPEPPE
jgi:flavin-binding protein dodecin